MLFHCPDTWFPVIGSIFVLNVILYMVNASGNHTSSHINDTVETVQENFKVDVVTKFLEQVELYEKNKDNCSTGTQHTLGKGVVEQYGVKRFKTQALLAVNRANFLTRIWKGASRSVLKSEYFFYTQVRSIVEGDPDIFAGGNCYDALEFKNYPLFCPYAFRTPDGLIHVKDLSMEYNYLGNDSEWFYVARKKASKLDKFNYTRGNGYLYELETAYIATLRELSYVTVCMLPEFLSVLHFCIIL